MKIFNKVYFGREENLFFYYYMSKAVFFATIHSDMYVKKNTTCCETVEKGNNSRESRSLKVSYIMAKNSDMTVIHFTLAASVFKISRK